MDRRLLEGFLAEGLSLEQIGLRVDRDPTTVSYWLRKHGLVANGRAKYAPRGGLTRNQLEPVVAAAGTLDAIARRLGVSVGTVRYWIGRHGLSRPLNPRREQIKRALQSGERAIASECRKHGTTEFIIEASGRARCKRCRSEAVVRRRRKAKRILVTEAGGMCQLCGYDRCMAALEFHHLNPAESRSSFRSVG